MTKPLPELLADLDQYIEDARGLGNTIAVGVPLETLARLVARIRELEREDA